MWSGDVNSWELKDEYHHPVKVEFECNIPHPTYRRHRAVEPLNDGEIQAAEIKQKGIRDARCKIVKYMRSPCNK